MLIRVRYHFNAVLPHNGGLFNGCITGRCFNNTTTCKYVHPKKVTGRKLRHTVKEVKNFIFHHLCLDNFLPVNLSNFFIGFNISNEFTVFLIPKTNFGKIFFWLLMALFFCKFWSQNHTKQLKNTRNVCKCVLEFNLTSIDILLCSILSKRVKNP
jgi:hypothetical protein